MSDISTPINKVDNQEKIMGKALYVDDIKPEGHLYAKTYRATISKGKIIKRNYPELPKGYWIVDYKDIPGNNYVQIIHKDWPVFAKDQINYYGEPILLVVGVDKEIILSIIEQIHIDYEECQPTYDYKDSVIHYCYEKGNGDEPFKDAKKVIRKNYHTGYQEQLYIEPQGVIGSYEHNQVIVKGSMQCPYYIKNALMNTLSMDEVAVRVIQTTTGGAFGGKEEYPSLIACQVAVAALKIKKPIKLIYSREEDIAYTTKRHPSTISIQGAINRNHKLTALKVHVSLNGGAYIGLSGVVLQRAMIAASGVYAIDHLLVEGDVYCTNTVPTGAFRGFGAPQMFFAIEMFMNHVAKDFGEEAIGFKKKYLSKQGDLTSTSGCYRESIILEHLIHRGEFLSSYESKLRKYSKDNKKILSIKETKESLEHKHYSSQSVLKGIGMSLFLHGCGFTGSGEQEHIKAVVRLRKELDDRVSILVASVDMGQGTKTTFRKIVANILDIPIKQVVFDNPDTDYVPDSGPTVASRTTMVVGGLLARAAKKLKERWDEGELVFVEEHYKQPDYIQWNQEFLRGDAYPAYSWGVHVVEVEVDPLTYEVTLIGAWAAYDVGKVIDQRILEGQSDGGMLQGICLGYLEVMNSHEGRIHQRSLTDYMIPTAVDTIEMTKEFVDNPYALGPYGAKGAGELTLIGGAPAVAMAIENAIGKEVTKIPVTPEYIMELMTDE